MLQQQCCSQRSLKEVFQMKTMQRFTANTIALAVLLALGACSGMSARDESTAIGAGVGAVGGAVLTGGSPVGVVGGAVVGGVIGNQVGKDDRKY
jgi:osmotically inducible lipoprotein OsmB